MLSNAMDAESTTNGPGLVIAICVVAILFGILCIVLALCRRRRAGQTQVYEEVEQGQRQKRAADTNIMMQETKEGDKE
ncbi:hypothetical protein AGOR_G00093100 [Albula goreensis]|uniref:Uncharacterized protein n=1 Tax=Albula goreensis TaxID=1534307 RepID=A0A8T3DG71_9TELE|nr:hypothetical protein AGOR_G00093100 [Albula goreensis]